MKIECISIYPAHLDVRPEPSGIDFVVKNPFGLRRRPVLVIMTGEDWELKPLKDLASLYEVNQDKSAIAEFTLTSQLVDRLDASFLTLENKAEQIERLRKVLCELEERDVVTNECT